MGGRNRRKGMGGKKRDERDGRKEIGAVEGERMEVKEYEERNGMKDMGLKELEEGIGGTECEVRNGRKGTEGRYQRNGMG
jgi:hypothetical protein